MSTKNFRKEWEGQISLKYKVPRYVEVFKEFFPEGFSGTVLELGAGTGEISDQLRRHFEEYTVTEIDPDKINVLKEKEYNVVECDAQKLPFPDSSFDMVICFDVMHHVNNPSLMAKEMMRVARSDVFLIEANRHCIIRRLLEKTKRYKKAGENSYYLGEYKEFFNQEMQNRPFLFMPPFTPLIFLPFVKVFNWVIERTPILKWQCSSIAMRVRI